MNIRPPKTHGNFHLWKNGKHFTGKTTTSRSGTPVFLIYCNGDLFRAFCNEAAVADQFQPFEGVVYRYNENELISR